MLPLSFNMFELQLLIIDIDVGHKKYSVLIIIWNLSWYLIINKQIKELITLVG